MESDSKTGAFQRFIKARHGFICQPTAQQLPFM
jgi:hypothetical protein